MGFFDKQCGPKWYRFERIAYPIMGVALIFASFLNIYRLGVTTERERRFREENPVTLVDDVLSRRLENKFFSLYHSISSNEEAILRIKVAEQYLVDHSE